MMMSLRKKEASGLKKVDFVGGETQLRSIEEEYIMEDKEVGKECPERMEDSRKPLYWGLLRMEQDFVD